MAIIIQKKESSINIINDQLAAGFQIVCSMPPSCVARANYDHKTIEFLSADKNVLKSIEFLDVQYQDFAGLPTPWSGTFDDLLDKLNNEYFKESVAVSISGVSTEAKQDDEITFLAQIKKLLSDAELRQDAFGRNRTSEPQTIFDSKQVENNQSLFFDDQTVSGTATSTYSANKASTTLQVQNLIAGRRVRQTFRSFNYQSGKSQLIMRSGVFGDKVVGVTKRTGIYNDKNGLFFQYDKNGAAVVVRSFVSGAAVDTLIKQSSWNTDRLDGGTASLINLDFKKTQVFVIDYAWLGVGTVAFGFLIDRKLHYCHFVNNANNLLNVYMSTPNLPLRTEIINDGTGAATDIVDICSTVISEGGRQRSGLSFGINRNAVPLTTLNDANRYILIGIRLKTTNLSATIEILKAKVRCTSTAEYGVYLVLSPTIVGVAPTWIALANSSVEVCQPTNTTRITGGTVLDTDLGSDSAAFTVGTALEGNDVKIGSSITGVPQELFLCVQRLTGTTETFYASLTIFENN